MQKRRLLSLQHYKVLHHLERWHLQWLTYEYIHTGNYRKKIWIIGHIATEQWGFHWGSEFLGALYIKMNVWLMRYSAFKFWKIYKALQKMVDNACGIARYAFGAHLRSSRTVPTMYTIKQKGRVVALIWFAFCTHVHIRPSSMLHRSPFSFPRSANI